MSRVQQQKECLLALGITSETCLVMLAQDCVTSGTLLTYLGPSFLVHKVRIRTPTLSPSCEMDIKSIRKTVKQRAKIVVVISGIGCAAWILHEEARSSNPQTTTCHQAKSGITC